MPIVVTVVVTVVVKTELRDSPANLNQHDVWIRSYHHRHVANELFDLDLLDEDDPFKIAHHRH